MDKYYTLSELPKVFQKQEEKKKEMTLEEKLIALEKEKEFLMQLMEKEELKKENQIETNYQKRKK